MGNGEFNFALPKHGAKFERAFQFAIISFSISTQEISHTFTKRRIQTPWGVIKTVSSFDVKFDKKAVFYVKSSNINMKFYFTF